MSLYIDVKYLQLLSSRLERYTRKQDYLWNCRCPLCGDSHVSKSKARGYFFRDNRNQNSLTYKCHNCQTSMRFGTFLKQFDPSLYKEYKFEQYRRPETPELKIPKPPTVLPPTPKTFIHAIRCDKLEEFHPCRLEIERRCIPKQFWTKLWYTPNYLQFLTELFPDHGKTLVDDARLVIPYYDTQGKILAVAGRSLSSSPNTKRYITIRITPGYTKLIYGLDRVDFTHPIYITEGPLDSLFLPNAVASGDSNLIAVATALPEAKMTLIFDNEKRNQENVEQIKKAIELGYQVLIWPEVVKEKDLNALRMSGKSLDYIKKFVDTNTWSGLTALTRLTFWKKCAKPNYRKELK